MNRVVCSRLTCFSLLVFASSFLFISTAVAQAVAVASLAGVVTDPSGAMVANATVTITETDKQLTRTVITDASGHYAFNDLPVGPYRIDVRAAGFKEYVQTGIELQVGSNVDDNVTMQLGNVSQTVEVQANAG
ncbi:MAG: carboxypeptidase regulatory-like domain-containing protein, partial [Acidobacteriaceae bacterium]|nr:carboxypeptidase regulatory-like domain-containing protein [Acidobacteriaceae bacterium]